MENHSELVIAVTALWAAAVISPGPDFAVTAKLALSRSRPAGLGAAAGISSGSLIYATLTMFGLSAVLEANEDFAFIIQSAGGLFLICLGVNAVRKAGTYAKPSFYPSPTLIETRRSDFFTGFRAGICTCMLNPKGIAFFLGLFAVGITADTPVSVKAALIASGVTIELLWYGSAGILFSRQYIRRAYARYGKYIDYLFGAFFFLSGSLLLFYAR